MNNPITQRGSLPLMTSIKDFFLKDKVFLVAFILAVISVIFGGFETKFFDYKVIFTVFGLMLVIGGFKSTGLLHYLGQALVKRSQTTRQLVRSTTMLTFFMAIFFTNDLTILTVLPLYLTITKSISDRRSVYIGAALILPAVHLGSSLFPFGNPHNLYAYSFFHMNNLEFFKGTGLLFIAGFIVLNLAVQFFISDEPFEVNTEVGTFNKLEAALYTLLMALMAASVFGWISYIIAAAITAVVILFYKPRLFAEVDYHLLLTFICFFLIVGNIVNIKPITELISSAFVGAHMSFLGTVLVSQVISNISSTVLISPFTNHGMSVLLGADVGGIGTVVASMATLISYKVIMVAARTEAKGFAKYFAYINTIFFIIFTLIGLGIVSIL